MYYLFAFRSRTNAMKFYENLKREGLRAEIISTPQSLGSGCGLSVKTNDFTAAKKVLSFGKYSTFTGAYRINEYGGVLNIVKL